MIKIIKNKSFFISFGLSLILAIIAVLPLLNKGLPPTHDGEYHVVRFYEFNKMLIDGSLYPRWAPDLNYGLGVPLFTYVYPLPNYIASFLHLFNISFIDAFKLNMFIAGIIGGVFFYLWSRKFWGNLGGIVSSIFYSFSPYHFVDVYVRGSVGEVWALAFFPAFLWAATNALKENQKKFIVVSGIFLALIIFSHNILALMFLFFSLFYCFLLIFKLKNPKYLILNVLNIVIIGLGLSAVFWLPALFEKQLVTGLQLYNVKENFVDLYQLIFPSWGTGFSNGELQNQMSLQIGIGNLTAIFISIIFFRFWIKKKEIRSFIVFFLFSFFLISFLMTRFSSAVWNAVPLMDYFQFPWRLLSLEILACSFLAGGMLSLIKNQWFKLSLTVFMVALVFLSGIGYAKPAYYLNRSDNYYITRSNFIDGTNSPGDYFNTIWANGNKKRGKEKIKLIKGDARIKNFYSKAIYYNFEISAKENSEFIASIAYFPGWQVYLDNKKIKDNLNKDGLIYFKVQKGNHTIEIKLEETFTQKVGKFIFLITLMLIIFILYKNSRCVKIK